MVMNRGQFSDLFLEDMLPELEDIICEKYDSKPDMIPQLFNVQSTDKSIVQSDTMGTFPTAVQIDEGESVSYFSATQGYDKTYRPYKYGLGMRVTEEMIEDEKWGLIAKFARALGKSVFEVRQISAANILNNGFSDTGPDGVSLFSASHPLLGGGTESNTASVDLSISALEDAITRFSDMRDDENKHISITPKVLLVPPALKFLAKEIINSQLRSDTGNNATNAFMDDDLMVMSWDYLTDSGAWYLLAEKDEHDINWIERRAPKTEGAFDFDTGSGKTKMTTRYDTGYNDWRGTYGAT